MRRSTPSKERRERPGSTATLPRSGGGRRPPTGKSFGTRGAAKTVSPLADTPNPQRPPSASAAAVRSHTLSPEEMRNQLDRFCMSLWEKRGFGPKPDGLAGLIRELSERGAIPMHQANMMHTVRGLRNAYVHDHIRIGPREAAILDNAWGIIHEWAEGCERRVWRGTSR